MLKHFKIVYQAQCNYLEKMYDKGQKNEYNSFDETALNELFNIFQINLQTFNKVHIVKYETILPIYRKYRAKKFDKLCKRYARIDDILKNYENQNCFDL